MSLSESDGSSTDVYVLQHSYEAGGCDETKLIGVYGSREEAEAAANRLRRQPGFREHPGEFHADRYPLNVDHWSEGFTSEIQVEPGDEQDHLDLKTAYLAAYYFVTAYWERGGRRDGSVTLLLNALGPSDSDLHPKQLETNDPAFWNDWLAAVERARIQGVPTEL